MKLTEKELRDIFQQQTARSTPRQTECLTENQFIRAATREISSEERRNIARHLITCIDCTEEYRALRSLEPLAEDAHAMLTASIEADPVRLLPFAEKVTRVSRWNGLFASSAHSGRIGLQNLGDSVATFCRRLIWEPRARRVAAITVMILVAGSSLLIWQSIRHRDPPASTERARVSQRLSVDPPDRATISEPPEKLAWSAMGNAITYRVVLYDFQSTPIWESSRLRATSATLPESVRQRLARTQPYYWRVIAEDAIDQRQSELFQFSLTAEERR